MAHGLDLRTHLLRLRVFPVAEGSVADPNSPEYLYLAQQKRRLALSVSAGRLRPQNRLLYPVIGLIVLARLFDLWMTNQIVQSMLNERVLLDLSGRTEPRE